MFQNRILCWFPVYFMFFDKTHRPDTAILILKYTYKKICVTIILTRNDRIITACESKNAINNVKPRF